jgi:hypothetical protein
MDKVPACPPSIESKGKKRKEADCEMRCGEVVPTYNPAYSEGGNQKDHSSGLAQRVREPISTYKQGLVLCICSPRYMGDTGRRIAV